jgi:hypothetical protein
VLDYILVVFFLNQTTFARRTDLTGQPVVNQVPEKKERETHTQLLKVEEDKLCVDDVIIKKTCPTFQSLLLLLSKNKKKKRRRRRLEGVDLFNRLAAKGLWAFAVTFFFSFSSAAQ